MAKKELSLFDGFQDKAVWWFPNRPDARLPGVLVRDGENFTLELFDGDVTVMPDWETVIPLSTRGHWPASDHALKWIVCVPGPMLESVLSISLAVVPHVMLLLSSTE